MIVLACFALAAALMNGFSYWAGMHDARHVDAVRSRKKEQA